MHQEISGTESILSVSKRAAQIQQFMLVFPTWEREYNLAYLQAAEQHSRELACKCSCNKERGQGLVFAARALSLEVMRGYDVRARYFKMAVDVMTHYEESKSPELLDTAEALVRKLIHFMPRH